MSEKQTRSRTEFRIDFSRELGHNVVNVVTVREEEAPLVPHPTMFDAASDRKPWYGIGDGRFDDKAYGRQHLAASLALYVLGGDELLARALARDLANRMVGQLSGCARLTVGDVAKKVLQSLQDYTVWKVGQYRARCAAGESVQAELEAYRRAEMAAMFRLSELIPVMGEPGYVHYRERDDQADDGQPF